METKSYRSSSHDRKLNVYLKPQLEPLFHAYVASNDMSISEALNVMVRSFFTTLPPDVKARIMQQGKGE